MAYLRKEKQMVEIDFSLNVVWTTIPIVLTSLEWMIEQTDDSKHHMIVKTKAGFMSYSSKLTVDGVVVNDTKCRLTVEGETPVTTITALTDFGKTSDRIELFFETLARQLHTAKKS